ncbi:methyltransferase domain-containing protein [Shewanella maritima]|uniref:methyltransferase domain-containing protein n=1 Tax=Shewanella maritima TaxID=2520507 RepID=UPI003735E991
MTLDNSLADKFSHAATIYRQHDVLQRLTAKHLQLRMQTASEVKGRLVDIGSGPGTDFSDFAFLSSICAVDIAQGMLAQVQTDFPHYQTLCSDVQTLAMQDHQADILYSNLALQWCEQLSSAATHLYRVLKPQGQSFMSLVADGSLTELSQLGFNVNRFLTVEQIKQAFTACETESISRWQDFECELVAVTVYFDDLKQLLYSIKGVGASLVTDELCLELQDEPMQSNYPANTKFMTKSQWRERCQLAEKLREKQGIPLTYQVAFIYARK